MSETVNIGDLKPDPANARKHNQRNIGQIVNALKEVGAARSIVIDEDGVILAGNGVTEAAAIVGIENVQVVDADGETIIAVRRTGLTDKQKRRLALADNRTAELAEWDIDQLNVEFDAGNLEGMFFDEVLGFGNTSTEREGQGVNSTWDQVKNTTNKKIILGELETHITYETLQRLLDCLNREYADKRIPIYETLETIISIGVDHVENSSD